LKASLPPRGEVLPECAGVGARELDERAHCRRSRATGAGNRWCLVEQTLEDGVARVLREPLAESRGTDRHGGTPAAHAAQEDVGLPLTALAELHRHRREYAPRVRLMRREALSVWLLLGVVALAVLVTYSRLPARELYHVSGSGLAGGAGRVLVFLNFPTALVAIAILAIVFERLAGRVLRALAFVAAVLCTPVFWPGVVDQADLDARWVNVPAAAGVGLALLLTLAASRERSKPQQGDRLRVVLAILALLAAPAWLAAELGFFLDGVPLLGRLYQSGPYLPQQAGLPPFPPAVHHGDHHGMDGVLLVLAALLLSRGLPAIRASALRLATAAYLALMLTYGLGNIANDFWIEQVGKRGWTSWTIPSVLEPALAWAWAGVIIGAAAVWLAWFRSGPALPPLAAQHR
jgi:hypothetical protein